MRDSGFSLVEVVFSVALTSLVLLSGIGAWVFAQKLYVHALDQSSVMQDAWVFYHALVDDISHARSYSFQGSTLNITEDDGSTSTYTESSMTGNVWRSLNGAGTAIVSAGVSSLTYEVLPTNGLRVSVTYLVGGVRDEVVFSAIFAEG